MYTSDTPFSAHTRNLSESGVCLLLGQLLTEGAVIGVSLFLATDGIEDPDVEPLNVKADVVWSSQSDGDTAYMAGAQFKEMSDDDNKRLAEFIGQLGS